MSLVRTIDGSTTQPPHNPSSSNILPMKTALIMIGVAIVIGTVTGWALGHGKAEKITSTNTTTSSGGDTPGTAGIVDKSTFKDEAEGVLKEGGIEGEGSFHLVRPGGESQYVYLTSSAVDLSEYIDKKVKVHGVTIAGQKAGWLMDVGFVELQ